MIPAKVRPVEAVVVPDERGGRSLMLRDTEGIAPDAVLIPASLAPVVARFDGRCSAAEIAASAGRATGRRIEPGVVVRLAEELEASWMLDSPRFRARRAQVVRDFMTSPVRSPSHAGGAYHGDAARLGRFIDAECLAKARPRPNGAGPRRVRGRLVAICAPHMDLWRAAEGYGHAYQELSRALADGSKGVDTFIVLGTSHARMRRPFAVCDKTFATPLGVLEPDVEAIRELSSRSRFDVLEDAYNHKGEHSIEFQVVFLKHLLGDRPARIVPVLCGLGDAQATGRDPTEDDDAESFLRALSRLVARRGDRVFVVAGADLAHVGPRFGDAGPLDAAARRRLAERDRASIDRAIERDEHGFFEHAVEDLDTRRVCGVGPIYAMLRAIPRAATGEVLNYAQCVDPEEGSIVSHASLGFYAAL